MLQIDIYIGYHVCFFDKSKPVNKQVGGSPDVSIEHHW